MFSNSGANPTDPIARDGVAERLTLLYDPTNGTISVSEVFRTDGTKPGGRMFDLLYSLSSGK